MTIITKMTLILIYAFIHAIIESQAEMYYQIIMLLFSVSNYHPQAIWGLIWTG
jgi:hypothetical protein